MLGFAACDAEMAYKKTHGADYDIDADVVDMGNGRAFGIRDPEGNYVQLFDVYPETLKIQRQLGWAVTMRSDAMSMTVGELFEALSTRFKSEAAAGLNQTLQWHITDVEPGVWAFEINDGQGRLVPGGVDNPDTTFTTSSETWVAIAEGRQDAMRAFMTGKLKVKGNMMLAMKVPKLFETGV